MENMQEPTKIYIIEDVDGSYYLLLKRLRELSLSLDIERMKSPNQLSNDMLNTEKVIVISDIYFGRGDLAIKLKYKKILDNYLPTILTHVVSNIKDKSMLFIYSTYKGFPGLGKGDKSIESISANDRQEIENSVKNKLLYKEINFDQLRQNGKTPEQVINTILETHEVKASQIYSKWQNHDIDALVSSVTNIFNTHINGGKTQ